MKRYIALLLAMLIFAGLFLAAFVPSSWFSRSQTAYASGDSAQAVYHLSGAVWQVQGVSGGEGYKLATLPLSPGGTGTQCCCTYLPCLLKKP